MRYDIEADWLWQFACNYRCGYCFIDPQALGSKVPRLGTPAEWQDGFRRTGRTWLLHITGGEPTVHPDFVEICRLLAQDHYLSLNSNLSHRSIEAFAEAVDPACVHFINAALHHDERQARGGLDAFVERVRLLKARGFPVLVTQVADTALLPRFDDLVQRMAAEGLVVFPKALRGSHQGRIYPQAYTDAERQQIRRLARAAREAAPELAHHLGEAPSINVFEEERRLEVVDYSGRRCGAGPRFVQINAQAQVLRCGSPVSFGNLLRGPVTLPKDERRCRTSYCPYFCDKYSVAPAVPAGRVGAGA